MQKKRVLINESIVSIEKMSRRFSRKGIVYYVRTVSSYLFFSFGTFDSFLAGLGINQFKPVQQSRHERLRAYCSNIYTVGKGKELLVIIGLLLIVGSLLILHQDSFIQVISAG